MSRYALLGWSICSSLYPGQRTGLISFSPLFCGAFLEWCPPRLGGKSRGPGHHQALGGGPPPRVFGHNLDNRPVRIHRRRGGRLCPHGKRSGQNLDGSGSRDHQRRPGAVVRSSTLAPGAGAFYHRCCGCRCSPGQRRRATLNRRSVQPAVE